MLDDGRSVTIGGGKRRALLALLLLNANKVVSADRLIDGLWGESPPATAAKSVQVHVSQLRKELRAGGGSANGGLVLTRGNGYVLHVEPGELDVERFEHALAEAQRSLAGGDPLGAEERLLEGLGLWRGPPLADFAYEPFAQPEIARLEELRLAALEVRIDARLELGDHDRLVGELEALFQKYPLRERFCAQLMLALYRCGRQAEALGAYRHAERMFRDELGIEPTRALRELEGRILAQDARLAPAVEPNRPPASARPQRPPAGSAVADRGPRRPLPVRGPVLVTVAALLLVAAAALALLGREDESVSRQGPALDAAANSLVNVDPSAQEAELTIPLPGRPTDLAASNGNVWIPTVNSAALTGVNARRRAITQTVPLPGAPDAVAIGDGTIWVADGEHGVLSRITPGYETASRIRYPRARRGAAYAGRQRLPRSSVSVSADAVWVTNGSRDLIRVDPDRGRLQRVDVGVAVNEAAVAGGAVWALAARAATVLRIDPLSNRVTDRIPIAGRPGRGAPFPIGIAVGRGTVWVLNGNTATVTRIDPSTRSVVTTVELGVERVPNEIAAAGTTAWVANSDGTLSRIDVGASAARSVWVGESLEEVATDGSLVWATSLALDQRLAGGSR